MKCTSSHGMAHAERREWRVRHWDDWSICEVHQAVDVGAQAGLGDALGAKRRGRSSVLLTCRASELQNVDLLSVLLASLGWHPRKAAASTASCGAKYQKETRLDLASPPRFATSLSPTSTFLLQFHRTTPMLPPRNPCCVFPPRGPLAWRAQATRSNTKQQEQC
eukprot:scaffold4342_cov234-Pinguiococcus_pyrenoidosus.AAC.6